MRYFALLLGALMLSGCITTSVIKTPSYGIQSTAGVGDVIYKYEDLRRDEVNAKTYGVKYELIYSGIANNQIKLVYREFSDEFARPAFTQDAQYDYEPGMRVTFKGASLLVTEASGQSIMYMVEKGFNDEKPAKAAGLGL